jgi:hypothetical protein
MELMNQVTDAEAAGSS